MVRSTSYADWVRNTSATAWSQTLVFGYARAVIQEHRYDRFATGHDLACGAVVVRQPVTRDGNISVRKRPSPGPAIRTPRSYVASDERPSSSRVARQ
jgi:hypothetical protein